MSFRLIYPIVFIYSTFTLAKELDYSKVLESINKQKHYPCEAVSDLPLTDCSQRNFWQEICNETNLEEKRQSAYQKVAKRYQTEIEKFCQKNFNSLSEYKKFKQKIESKKNPLFKFTLKETLENYEQFFTTKNKSEVYSHLIHELAPNLFMHPRHYLMMNLYTELDTKLKSNLEQQAFNFATTDMAGPYQNVLSAGFEKLEYNEFKELIKKIIATNYNVTWGLIEDEVEQNRQFAKNITQNFLPTTKKNSIKKLFAIALKNLPDEFKPYVTKATTLEFAEKKSSNPHIDFKSTILEKNAHYDKTSKRIMVYAGYGDEGEEFTLIRALGHELGHAIMDTLQGTTASLQSCFQSADSIGASEDELGETFADWIGTEVLVRFMQTENYSKVEQQAIVKSALFTCAPISLYQKINSNRTDPHPRWDHRVNRIIFAHPKIKALWSCKAESGANYCERGAK